MKSLLKLTTVFFITAMLSSCWTKLGDLSVLSNRVIHDNTEYVELARYIEGKGHQKKKSTGALENAVEDCIKQVPNGEFLKNVTIHISNNGRRVKIKADVWGNRTENYVQKENIKGFNVGDRVQNGKRTGTIISLVDEKQCLVQFDGDAYGSKMEYERLIKIDDKKTDNSSNNTSGDGFTTNGYKVGDAVQFTSKDYIPAKVVTGKITSISTDGTTVNVEFVLGNKYKTVTVPINELSKGGN